MDYDIANDYQCRIGNQNNNTQPIANPKEYACFNYLNEKRDTCYSTKDCTIQNNVCASNHTSNPVNSQFDELTCKSNG
jgi:hypothetical protein